MKMGFLNLAVYVILHPSRLFNTPVLQPVQCVLKYYILVVDACF